jgi:hypothetical protein
MAVCHRSRMPYCDLNGFRAGIRRRVSPASASTPRLRGADQLRARGAGGWPVAEREKKGRRYNPRRRVVEVRHRVAGNGQLGQRYNGCAKSNRRASAVAIAEAAALVRLSVGAMVLVRLSGAVHRHVMPARSMAGCAGGRVDDETAVHRAGMQLHWLDHTDGEPDSEYAGETSEEPVTAHRSNIW